VYVALWTFGQFRGTRAVGNSDGPGGYDFIFQGGAPREIRFEVAVTSDEAGQQLLSPRVSSATTETGCDGTSGRQHVRINFVRNS